MRLRPAPHCRTPITGYPLQVEPKNHFVSPGSRTPPQPRRAAGVPEPATDLAITMGLVAEMTVINPFDFLVESYAERSGFTYPPDLAQDPEPCLRPVGDSPLLGAGLGDRPELTAAGRPIVGLLIGLNRQIAGDVAYSVRMEPGVRSPDTTLQRAVGSCRDRAWMLVAALRELGLAARFVSGYLVQIASDTVPGGTPAVRRRAARADPCARPRRGRDAHRGRGRLTLGGEPTFVAEDDMSSPQRTVAADGPEKRERADALATKLFAQFTRGGVGAPRPGQVIAG